MPEPETMCRNCKYYERVTGKEYGECKRYAPRPETEESRIGRPPIWTTVMEDMWCGEFKEKEQ